MGGLIETLKCPYCGYDTNQEHIDLEELRAELIRALDIIPSFTNFTNKEDNKRLHNKLKRRLKAVNKKLLDSLQEGK